MAANVVAAVAVGIAHAAVDIALGFNAGGLATARLFYWTSPAGRRNLWRITMITPAPRIGRTSLRLLLSLSLILSRSSPAQQTLVTEANVPVELRFEAKLQRADPFNDVTLDLVFDAIDGKTFRLPAFWAGGAVWKARFANPHLGKFQFHSECSDTNDAGLQNIVGTIQVKPYTGTNPLYLHGPIRVAADHRHFIFADDKPFFWLGDTWWMGLSHRLHWPEDVQTLAADRKAKGFNVIQIVAGLYPDMPPFDPRGANEAGFPWATNYSTIRPEYFDAADQRLGYLVDQGFTPCIVGAWGYFMPWMGVAKAKAHWRYLIARYGAMPVVWCAAGEANLPWYLAKGFPFDDRKQVRDWTEVMRFIRATDPFHRPLTIHPTGIGRLSARHATDDAGLLDFDLLQTPHGQREAAPVTINTVRESFADSPVMPVIDGEASYEMLGDSLPTEWTRQMFWLCLMNGAAGHTYGANGIWQVNRPGDPHGASPHGGNYGKIPWNEAMNLPGSRQVALGKKLFERYHWQEFKPHPEWAVYAGNEPALSLDSAQWIWFPEGIPARNAPAAKRFFRRTFAVPEGQHVQSARLRITADDRFTVRLDGEEVGSGSDWREARQFNNLQRLLRPGKNVLAVEAENLPATTENPAGLVACLELQYAGGETIRLTTDDTWRSSTNAPGGWDGVPFDDAGWRSALPVARFGGGPWGRPDATEDAYGPQTTGIAGGVRITYVPRNRPILETGLQGMSEHGVEYFDPVDGTSTRQSPRSSPDGSLEIPAPVSQRHDWVVIVEPKKRRDSR